MCVEVLKLLLVVESKLLYGVHTKWYHEDPWQWDGPLGPLSIHDTNEWHLLYVSATLPINSCWMFCCLNFISVVFLALIRMYCTWPVFFFFYQSPSCMLMLRAVCSHIGNNLFVGSKLNVYFVDVDSCCNVKWLMLFVLPLPCSYMKSINGCHFWLSIKGLPKCWRILWFGRLGSIPLRMWQRAMHFSIHSDELLNGEYTASYSWDCVLWKWAEKHPLQKDQVKLKVIGEVLCYLFLISNPKIQNWAINGLF